MLKGFKDFISRGNVVDLAIAVVLGAAFGAVITALVDGFISPLIAMVFGEPSLSHVLSFEINNAVFRPGHIMDAGLKFLLIAAAIFFLVVLPLNKFAERRKRGQAAGEEIASPTEVELLTEIRDALNNRPQA